MNAATRRPRRVGRDVGRDVGRAASAARVGRNAVDSVPTLTYSEPVRYLPVLTVP